MPWMETDPMDQRARFIAEWKRNELSMSDLCGVFEVSRKTGYKWVERYEAEGRKGLVERSRAPHSCPHAMAPEVGSLIVAARKRHPTWGPRKLIRWLGVRRPELELPAASTAGELLKRHGLSEPRRRKRRVEPQTQPFKGCDEPNATWCADFKGHFGVGDGKRCYPLTISDAYSRYLLCCRGLTDTGEADVRPFFERTFQEYGLPGAIRTDNGPPFASKAIAGLSRLSIWWVRLGILPERIAPGKPQQNGRHERMHLTLKKETALPPRSSLPRQQGAFDNFRGEYNNERPHEALGQRPPAALYQPSPRRLPRKLPQVEYPTHFEVRHVRTGGEIKWRGELVFVSEVLAGEYVGFEETESGLWIARFGPIQLGFMDAGGRMLRRVKGLLSPAVRE